jgi:hypothetical protein
MRDMKKNLKKNKNLFFIIALLVLAGIYLFLRLYKFEEKTTYHLDQGLHLLESYQMVQDKKIRLIGPLVTSKTYLARGFFIGPQYYYVLAFLGILTKWNPIIINVILLLAEFAFVLYFTNWIRKKYGTIEALTIFSLLTFSRYFIIHSRFFWNPHFLLPLGILFIVFLDRYIKKNKTRDLVWIGIWWGIAFGFHYSAVFWAIPLLIVLLKNKQLWKWQILSLPLFFILGDLPWFLFELKHSFYNLKTIFWVMTLSSHDSDLTAWYYYIYPLGIFLLFGLVWIINKFKRNKVLVSLFIVLLLSYLQIRLINDPIPLGMPIGWNYPLQKQIVNKILENGCPKDFNVASTVSGDTRSYDLRFLLTTRGCPPMGVEEYPKAEKLFLVAPMDRPPEKETVWEVSSLGKFKINEKNVYNQNVVYYELEKE